MNEKQAEIYSEIRIYIEIRNSYKTDPRWLEAKATIEDSSASAEEVQWAIDLMARLERNCHKAAERARLTGL